MLSDTNTPSKKAKQKAPTGDDSSILSQSLLQELEVDLQEKVNSIEQADQMGLSKTKNMSDHLK